MKYSKKLEKLFDQEIKSQIPGYDEEKTLEELGFIKKKKKPNPISIWSIRICYSIAIIMLSAILSITIYSKIQDNQYEKNEIVDVASRLFDEEMDKLGKNTQIIFVSPIENVVFGIYQFKSDETYKLVYYCTSHKQNYSIMFNNEKISIDYGLFIQDITLNETNEIKIFIDEEEVYSTIF